MASIPLNMIIHTFNSKKSDGERGEIYKNKGLALIEKPIHKFPKYYYIPAI